jgi:hypothetical protein
MALDDLVRSGVALANRLTGSFQGTVQHRAFVSDSTTGGPPNFSAAVPRQALIVLGQKAMRTKEGEDVVRYALVTFISPVVVTVRDEITLPDGSSGPVVDIGGLLDSDTGRPYFPEVSLGR